MNTTSGEKNLTTLLQSMKPALHAGEYVFCSVANTSLIPAGEIILLFKEPEGTTLIIKKETADAAGLTYAFVASWITLTVHSSLEAVGLTAAFSGALAKEGISCNVVAAFYHDHIFVDKKDAEKAMDVLNTFQAMEK
jgi:uncharacterized protein